jgi:hypothetical protein
MMSKSLGWSVLLCVACHVRGVSMTFEPFGSSVCLQVVTYNILADQYASSDKGRKHIFQYCPWRCSDRHAQCAVSQAATLTEQPSVGDTHGRRLQVNSKIDRLKLGARSTPLNRAHAKSFSSPPLLK